MRYVQESNTKIGGFEEATVAEVPKKKPNISIVTKEHVEIPVPNTEYVEQIQNFEPIVEDHEDQYVEGIEPITEDHHSTDEILIETFMQMRDFLTEQQKTQAMMGKMLVELIETVKTQNLFIQQKFDQLDESAIVTANVLREASEKLEALIVREIAIPAPVVNVSLSEQKKIVKTVNRDANGLISQITEEIQQSVSEDK